MAFYKPQGNLNEHAGYTDVASGDAHIADLIAHLQKSPQWKNMVVIVTYDENGGFWDHVGPPKGDRWGPGTRIPALDRLAVCEEGVRRSHAIRHDVDPALHHAPLLAADAAGLASRDAALVANGGKAMGDLTDALDFSQ